MVVFSRNNFVVAAPQGVYGLSSFLGRDQGQVNQYLYTAMSAQNPGWIIQEIPGNTVLAIVNALKIRFGKGPTGCMVFHNGDSACFQFNPLNPHEAQYLTGTARDNSGQSIQESGGINGGTSLDMIFDKPNVGWGRASSGSLWLFCMLVDGAVVECWTERIDE